MYSNTLFFKIDLTKTPHSVIRRLVRCHCFNCRSESISNDAVVGASGFVVAISIFKSSYGQLAFGNKKAISSQTSPWYIFSIKAQRMC